MVLKEVLDEYRDSVSAINQQYYLMMKSVEDVGSSVTPLDSGERLDVLNLAADIWREVYLRNKPKPQIPWPDEQIGMPPGGGE